MEILIAAIGFLGSTIGIHNFYEDYVVGNKRIFESARGSREKTEIVEQTKGNNGFPVELKEEKGKVIAKVLPKKEKKTVDEKTYQYYNKVGYEKQQLGNFQEAINNYTKSIELQPINAVAYNNMGVIYEENEMPHKAIIAYYGAGLSFEVDNKNVWEIYRAIENIAMKYEIDADRELDALAKLGNNESS